LRLTTPCIGVCAPVGTANTDAPGNVVLLGVTDVVIVAPVLVVVPNAPKRAAVHGDLRKCRSNSVNSALLSLDAAGITGACVI
jgi:hypothetical protein